MGKKALILFTLLLLPYFLFGGDIASFLNLGFSADSKYFMFGMYGIETDSSYPYANFYIVDIARNDFVSQGVMSEEYTVKADPGNTGIGGLFSLLEKNYPVIQKYNINHLKTGRILYVLFDGEKPRDVLEFRDFNTETDYTIKLVQSQRESGDSLSARFYIETDIKYKSGKHESFTVGQPSYYRKKTKEYRIKYIFLAPDGKSLIFVIEKDIPDKKGISIRYMVETKKVNG